MTQADRLEAQRVVFAMLRARLSGDWPALRALLTGPEDKALILAELLTFAATATATLAGRDWPALLDGMVEDTFAEMREA